MQGRVLNKRLQDSYLKRVSDNNIHSDFNFKIIQCSPPRTASTLMVNLIAGLILPRYSILFRTGPDSSSEIPFILKTHHTDITDWKEKYPDEKLYFIATERDGYGRIEKKYHSCRDVIIFNYNELLETENYSVKDIVDDAHERLLKFLTNDVILNKDDAVKRIHHMNEIVEYCKYRPFEHCDSLTNIHGSHRNRGK
jgi:hypothetical protein